MSLLNDALRAAEQRQSRPTTPGAYVGGHQQANNGRPLLVAILVAVVLLVVGISSYWLLAGRSSPEVLPLVVDRELENESVELAKPAPEPEVIEPDLSQVEAPAPEPMMAQREAPESLEPETPEPEVTEPEVTKPELTKPEPAAETEAGAPTEQPSTVAEEPQPEQVSTAGVKQMPETPAATDRSTARDLERLVAKSNITGAERRLVALTREQTAPRSRYVVARALLVNGKQEQALGWLPANVVEPHANLRLLRARALHASQDLAAALDTLASNVPPVDGHVEYRVTLATLLQQQGESAEAARQWAELIAWDDSQAPWWVGLAISLEAQGEQAGAARAYRQAAELPGLPPSLADYVRQRLQALRAG
ncbi:hypothetical protein NLU14_13765 [Marinobacter sp. 71-i]|uniref:MSHA biogenesis protein MshN n=1 Tax=Marinobacter iranensis TaxID=2962607 RepID=A0ABT5YC86_9GAMM|nr:hypothetical protein [Marinobacter iranensis]MDF0751292.1 hypothetical protein [Marinobacter iranensis]